MSDLSPESRRVVITWPSLRNKAVAIGAISYYIDHFVIGRISKFTYGVLSNTLFDPSNPDHIRRSRQSIVDAMGDKRIPGRFNIMLTRVRHAHNLHFAFRIELHHSGVGHQGSRRSRDPT